MSRTGSAPKPGPPEPKAESSQQKCPGGTEKPGCRHTVLCKPRAEWRPASLPYVFLQLTLVTILTPCHVLQFGALGLKLFNIGLRILPGALPIPRRGYLACTRRLKGFR